MKILAEMPTGMGSKWILAEFENNFYGYGTVAGLCRERIKKHQKELSKEKKSLMDGKLMIEHEQKELEMLIEFIRVLSK